MLPLFTVELYWCWLVTFRRSIKESERDQATRKGLVCMIMQLEIKHTRQEFHSKITLKTIYKNYL